MGICYIFGAGEYDGFEIDKKDGDIIIAADGGLKYLFQSGISPDYVIGDFDSLGYIPDSGNVIKLDPVKDVTDMFSAVEKGTRLAYNEFVIYGGTGGREDHTLANYQLAAYLAEKGCSVTLVNGKKRIIAISDGSVCFDEDKKGYISVFAHSDICTGVTLSGLKYPLENAVLRNTFALGVSNEFTGVKSSVSVKKGILIIMYTEN